MFLTKLLLTCCLTVTVVFLQLQSGLAALQREEAAFRGALALLQSSKEDEVRTRAIGQLTAVFEKMKEEILFLRDANTQLKEREEGQVATPRPSTKTSSGTSRRQLTADYYPWDDPNILSRQISAQFPFDPTTPATTTTTRRPKATSAPQARTLSDKEREMYDAAARGWDVSIASLCGEGITPNAADVGNSSYTPLHQAGIARQLPAAMTLVRCGANVNAQDSDGNTPMHGAIAREDHWMTGLLLLAKANPLIQNRQGRTPLQMAATARDSNFLPMFNLTRLAWFSGYRRLNTRERLVRQYIASGYYFEIAKICMDEGMDMNVGDFENNRNTAMHIAATSQWNHPMLVQTIVRCGGNVNVVNLQGNSPLLLAVTSGNMAATAALLLHGADPYISNSLGQTPYSLASASQNTYIRGLFTYPRIEWYLNNMLLS